MIPLIHFSLNFFLLAGILFRHLFRIAVTNCNKVLITKMRGLVARAFYPFCLIYFNALWFLVALLVSGRRAVVKYIVLDPAHAQPLVFEGFVIVVC